ncbi:MAG: DUF2237 domain-containing protein [Verrucomicrobiales bacterium]
MPENIPLRSLNVLGTQLAACCMDPMTGYFRDGYCHTGGGDQGIHTVCAVMTEEFLEFSRKMGNDLSTPVPQYQFPGLTEGDRWCLCVERWVEAHEAGRAPKVILEATHASTLEFVDLEVLQAHAFA